MKKWVKWTITGITAMALIAVVVVLYLNTDIDSITALIGKYPKTSVAIYLGVATLLYFVVPSAIYSIGFACFGWWSLLLCYIVSIVASVLCYIVGKWGGKPFIYWLFGRDEYEQARQKLTAKNTAIKALYVAYIIPISPDNLFAVVAGGMNVSFGQFAVMTLLTRALTVPCNILIWKFGFTIGGCNGN